MRQMARTEPLPQHVEVKVSVFRQMLVCVQHGRQRQWSLHSLHLRIWWLAEAGGVFGNIWQQTFAYRHVCSDKVRNEKVMHALWDTMWSLIDETHGTWMKWDELLQFPHHRSMKGQFLTLTYVEHVALCWIDRHSDGLVHHWRQSPRPPVFCTVCSVFPVICNSSCNNKNDNLSAEGRYTSAWTLNLTPRLQWLDVI